MIVLRSAFLAFMVALSVLLVVFQVWKINEWMDFDAIQGIEDLIIPVVGTAFFLFVDYFIFRVLANYFSNGASAFISLRYLRKRPISLLSVLGVATGVFVLVVVNSLMTGFVREYKTQIQGSLSDVIIKVDSGQFEAPELEVEDEVWAICWQRVNDDEELRAQWEHALTQLAKAYPESAGAYENAPDDAFPSGEDPAQIRLEKHEVHEVLEKLNQADCSESESFELISKLPRHPKLGLATPVYIWLASTSTNPEEREKNFHELKTEVRSKFYYQRLMEGNRFLKSALANHEDYEAASPRIQNFAPVRKRPGRHQKTAIYAVDQVDELKISSVGSYMKNAAFRDFQERYHMLPLMRLLEYSLLFEVPEKGVMPHISPVSLDEDGKLVVHYSTRSAYLKNRQMIQDNGNVLWAYADTIAYRPDSPGKGLYDLLERYLKRMETTLNATELRKLQEDSYAELLEFCDRFLEMATKRGDSLEGDPLGDEYPGDAACIGFLRDELLLEYPWRRKQYAKSARDWIRSFKEFCLGFPGEAPQSLVGLLEELESIIERNAGLIEKSESVEDLSKKTDTLANEIKEATLTLLKNSEAADAILEYEYRVDSELRKLTTSPQSELFANYKGTFLRSLSRYVERWENEWELIQRKQEAYASTLPLRTIILDDESVYEYELRARNMLPYIPSDSWAETDPEFLQRAKEGIRKRLQEGLIDYRLAGKAVPEVTLPESAKPLLPVLSQSVSEWLKKELNDAKSLKALRESMRQLQSSLANQMYDFATENDLAPDEVVELKRFLYMLKDFQTEYWLVSPRNPTLIIGDALRSHMRRVEARRDPSRPDDLPGMSEVDLTVLRQYQPTFGGDDPKLDVIPKYEFHINGVFRSGLFDDNLHTMYGDYESWVLLLGATDTDLSMGMKVKDYTPYAGKPISLQMEVEDALSTGARRTLNDEDAPRYAKSAAFVAQGNAGYYVSVWEQEREKMLRAVERERILITFLIAFVVVLAGVLILIVVYLTVVEKVKDIGILNALGASPWGVRSIFCFNALFIGLFGAILGSIGAIWACETGLNSTEQLLYEWFGWKLFPPDIYYLEYLPMTTGSELHWLTVQFAAPTVMWAFCCGLLPARSAARKQPIEALHYE